MQAIILAGGFGSRLRASVSDVPKPMAPILQKPFLAYLLDYLSSQGIKEVLLVVHYLREKIQTYFQNKYGNMYINFVIEKEPLGTGGAILNALSYVKDLSKSILVLNGDTFLKLNYKTMLQEHEQNNALLTIALRYVSDASRYGNAIVQNNHMIGFKENGGIGPGLINAGVYLIHPQLFSAYQLPKHFSFEKDFIRPFCSMIKPHVFLTDDYFIDIGLPQDYAQALKELPFIIQNSD